MQWFVKYTQAIWFLWGRKFLTWLFKFLGRCLFFLFFIRISISICLPFLTIFLFVWVLTLGFILGACIGLRPLRCIFGTLVASHAFFITFILQFLITDFGIFLLNYTFGAKLFLFGRDDFDAVIELFLRRLFAHHLVFKFYLNKIKLYWFFSSI